MAVASYDAALTGLLRYEGGYTDHPSDPGGPTNFGITLADARRYWKGNATADDVRAMPQTVARKIYRERYWNALRCDELPAGIDYAVFDYGVNSGIGRAGKVLRRVLGLPDRTSVVTDDVIAACVEYAAGDIIRSICTERLAFLKSLKTFAVFGRGWTARVSGVRAAALSMASDRRTVAAPVSDGGSVAKAVVPATIPAGPVSAGAVVAAGSAAVITTSRLEVTVIVAGAAALAAVAIFLIWRWRHRIRQEAAIPSTEVSNGLG